MFTTLLIVALGLSVGLNATLIVHAFRNYKIADEAWDEGFDEGLARAALVAVFWRARGDALASVAQFWYKEGFLPKALNAHLRDASGLAKDAIRQKYGDFDVPEDLLVHIAQVARDVGTWAEQQTRPNLPPKNGHRPKHRQPAPPPPEDEPEWLPVPR